MSGAYYVVRAAKPREPKIYRGVVNDAPIYGYKLTRHVPAFDRDMAERVAGHLSLLTPAKHKAVTAAEIEPTS